jgi:hypothetical protein
MNDPAARGRARYSLLLIKDFILKYVTSYEDLISLVGLNRGEILQVADRLGFKNRDRRALPNFVIGKY